MAVEGFLINRIVGDVEHGPVVQGRYQTFIPENALRRVGLGATDERLHGSFFATTQDKHYAFFFSSRRRHTRSYGDWSSDVCSSDLLRGLAPDGGLYMPAEIARHSP